MRQVPSLVAMRRCHILFTPRNIIGQLTFFTIFSLPTREARCNRLLDLVTLAYITKRFTTTFNGGAHCDLQWMINEFECRIRASIKKLEFLSERPNTWPKSN